MRLLIVCTVPDVPRWPDLFSCFHEHKELALSKCSPTLEEMRASNSIWHVRMKVHNVPTIDLFDGLCDSQYCPALLNGQLVAWDTNGHITISIVQYLTTWLYAHLIDVLAAPETLPLVLPLCHTDRHSLSFLASSPPVSEQSTSHRIEILPERVNTATWFNSLDAVLKYYGEHRPADSSQGAASCSWKPIILVHVHAEYVMDAVALLCQLTRLAPHPVLVISTDKRTAMHTHSQGHATFWFEEYQQANTGFNYGAVLC
jgi:hypothetical protein